MALDPRTVALQERAVQKLVDAHATRRDERLVLALRFQHEDRDVHLLEILDGWPGGDDDPLSPMEFAPTADLLFPGMIQLLIGSPAQIRAALARGDDVLGPVRLDGSVVVRSHEADDVIAALGARERATSGQQAARQAFVAGLDPEQRATANEKEEILRSWRP
jgi:hypothetical protein